MSPLEVPGRAEPIVGDVVAEGCCGSGMVWRVGRGLEGASSKGLLVHSFFRAKANTKRDRKNRCV